MVDAAATAKLILLGRGPGGHLLPPPGRKEAVEAGALAFKKTVERVSRQ